MPPETGPPTTVHLGVSANLCSSSEEIESTSVAQRTTLDSMSLDRDLSTAIHSGVPGSLSVQELDNTFVAQRTTLDSMSLDRDLSTAIHSGVPGSLSVQELDNTFVAQRTTRNTNQVSDDDAASSSAVQCTTSNQNPVEIPNNICTSVRVEGELELVTDNRCKALIIYTPPSQRSIPQMIEEADNNVYILYEPLRDLVVHRLRFDPLFAVHTRHTRWLSLRSHPNQVRHAYEFYEGIGRSLEARFSSAHNHWTSFGGRMDIPSAPRKYVLGTHASVSLGESVLTAFTIFSNLPIEMRQKIWKAVAHIPRVLEVRYDQLQEESYGHHYGRIQLPSCRTPEMLHVCQEARQEGLRFYRALNIVFQGPEDPEDFDLRREEVTHSQSEMGTSRPRNPRFGQISKEETYYNPDADIIFFGEKTCEGTVTSFIRSCPDISRVAIVLSKVEQATRASHPTCGRTCTSHPDYVIETSAESFGPGADRVGRMLAILHGFDTRQPNEGEGGDEQAGTDQLEEQEKNKPEEQHEEWYPGVSGLRQIFFVVDPIPVLPGPSTVAMTDCTTGIVPVSYEFVRQHAPRDQENAPILANQISRIENDDGLDDTGITGDLGGNRWAGNKKPSISFGRIVFPSYATRVFEHWAVRLESWKQFRKLMPGWNPIDPKCVLGRMTLYPARFTGPGHYLVTFEGKPDEVEKHKSLVANSYFDDTGDLLGADITIVELSDAVMPYMGVSDWVSAM